MSSEISRVKPVFHAALCGKKSGFDACHIALIRQAIDESEELQKAKLNVEGIKKMVEIVEEFLARKKLICYGGTAINNLLPKNAQFYDKDTQIPDYDFFSPTPLEDAKELADIYFKAGFAEVEAKTGVHHGTFKVFVDYTPMADITYMHPALFRRLMRDSVSVLGIHYCPPDFLRMNMYLELSRPAGDVSRWEKVAGRLLLLNEHRPMISKKCGALASRARVDARAELIRTELVGQGAVFLGGYAADLYIRKATSGGGSARPALCFDAICAEHKKAAEIIRERLREAGAKAVDVVSHPEFAETLPAHSEVRVGGRPVAVLYQPVACHNYNEIEVDGAAMRVATIDTMMNFYLALYYTGRPGSDAERVLCMAQFLFDLSQRRLDDSGLLKRYSTSCYGVQPTLSDMRTEKTLKKRDPALKKGTVEYEMWFLQYSPGSSAKGTTKKNAASPTAARKKRRRAKKTRRVRFFS